MLLLLLFVYFNFELYLCVFMMQKLNSLGLLSYTNSNLLETQENGVQKVTGATSAKESFSVN